MAVVIFRQETEIHPRERDQERPCEVKDADKCVANEDACALKLCKKK